MTILGLGMEGPEVEELQERLRELGFDESGRFGPVTDFAVRRFQESRGLLPDGRVGPRTREALAEAEPPAPPPDDAEEGPPIDRTLRLPEGQFVQEVRRKDLIVLHHTVGGSARSTFNHWRDTPARIATAYLVERDGVVHEVFDPRFWAFHLGIAGQSPEIDRRSIGIEIASEGPLKEGNGGFTAFSRPFRGEVFDHRESWRGQGRFWAAYTEAQVESVIDLVDHLCEVFPVPRRTPVDHLGFDTALFAFEGVLAHHQVRADKSDLHPGFPWDELIGRTGLEAV